MLGSLLSVLPCRGTAYVTCPGTQPPQLATDADSAKGEKPYSEEMGSLKDSKHLGNTEAGERFYEQTVLWKNQ